MKKGIIGLLLVGMLMGCTTTQKEEITLTFKEMDFIEYGSSFDTKECIEETNGNIDEYPTLDTSHVGKQKLSFVVVKDEEKKTFDYEVEVKDTQNPIIEVKKDKDEIEYNGKYDALDYISSVKDPADGDIEYKAETDVKDDDNMYYTYHSDVDIKKAGDYTIHYIAVDKNMNKAEKDVLITVHEEKKEEQEEVKKEPVKSSETASSSPKKTETTKPKQDEVTTPQQNEEVVQPKEPQQSDYSYVLTSTIAKTKSAQSANKIVTVTSTSPSSRKGIVQYFVKSGGQWVEQMKVDCQLGKAGMGQGSEYSTRTPVGTYHFTHAYGINPNPGSKMAYTQINEHHYWCGEKYYNQFIDDSVTTDHKINCSKEKDEKLIDYPGSYNYFASFNYNPGNVPGVGCAYFLHCAKGKYTMGCIGIPESNMIYLLQNIDTSTVMIIDQVNKVANH